MSGQQNENAATAAGRTEMEDLPQPEKELTADEAKDVKGGLLLPAVQSVREAARRQSTAQDSAWGDPHIKGVTGDGSV